MKDIITIIIPCKNERDNIYECIKLISKQTDIIGTNIIIADNSDELESLHFLKNTKRDFQHILNIEIIKGGFPAKARVEGSKLVKTPYILFLDADIMLQDKSIIADCLTYCADLVTV
jgi:glycosyltransferase involved in cell wall biosynthesis